MTNFTDIEQIFQKFVWNHKRPYIATAILRKQNKGGEIKLPNIKLYQEVIVIKTARYCHKNKHIGQWNREPRNKPIPLQSINIQQRKQAHIQCVKDSLFNKCYWENWLDTCRKMILDHHLIPHTRINSKWIKDLNVRPKP